MQQPVRELGAVARLELRQQVELAAVTQPVMNSALRRSSGHADPC